jgi:glycosyltransferase involved in cell wall biosynthesis
MVSVWMTTYNHEKYISEAIEGVINQKTTFAYELVIGEDFSTDKTREICVNYRDKFPDLIKLILNNKNIGLISNYITTLFECKGKYVAYCDGDDYWTDPSKLQKQVDFLEEHKFFDMVFTEKHVQVGQKIYQGNLNVKIPDITFESLVISNMICTPTVMIRSEIAKKYSPDVAKTAFNHNWLTFDYPLWLEISGNHKIGFIPDPTCVYRIVPDSGSHRADTFKAYLWDKSLLDIQLYYYGRYIKHYKNIKQKFKNKFKEMVFHTRKSMVVRYGWIAYRDLFDILRMNPVFYFFLIYSKLVRLLKREKS